jgi:hypothetical protein
MEASQKSDLSSWRRHLQDEVDAAYLYRRLAGAERDPAERNRITPLTKERRGHDHLGSPGDSGKI